MTALSTGTMDIDSFIERRIAVKGDIERFVDIKDTLPKLMPGESFEKDNVRITSRKYGNHMIENIYRLDSGVSFSAVYASTDNDLYSRLCSANFVADDSLGSYDSNTNIVPTPHLEPILLPINHSLPLTDIEVIDNIAYITADSNIYSESDIMSFDLNSISSPTLISSVNSGPGLTSLIVYMDKIYTSAPSTAQQLHIFNIDSDNHITLNNKIALGLPSTSSPPTIGSTVTARNNFLFLGTEKWDGNEVEIFDIGDSSSIKHISGIEIGSKVNDLLSYEDSLFVAGSNIRQLSEYDISNIYSPTLIQEQGYTGYERQEGKSIEYFEDDLVFGRTSGGFNIIADKELFDFNQEWNIGMPNISIDISGGIYGTVTDRKNIYFISRQADKEFGIINKFSTTSPTFFSLPVLPQSISCDGDDIYVLGKNSPYVYKINFYEHE